MLLVICVDLSDIILNTIFLLIPSFYNHIGWEIALQNIFTNLYIFSFDVFRENFLWKNFKKPAKSNQTCFGMHFSRRIDLSQHISLQIHSTKILVIYLTKFWQLVVNQYSLLNIFLKILFRCLGLLKLLLIFVLSDQFFLRISNFLSCTFSLLSTILQMFKLGCFLFLLLLQQFIICILLVKSSFVVI